MQPVCGNGEVEGSEVCDDGNRVDDDACSNACVLASCGDGVVQMPEECDDQNMDDTDACKNDCTYEPFGDCENMLWRGDHAHGTEGVQCHPGAWSAPPARLEPRGIALGFFQNVGRPSPSKP